MDIGKLYDREVDRLMRCIPFWGIVFWIYQYRKRMVLEAQEDKAYLAIMATMGVNPEISQSQE